MLLSSLSILMSAILVPFDYVGLYSTHIILVCLYLITVKRWIVLGFIFLSLISAIDSEVFVTKILPIKEDDNLSINLEESVIYLPLNNSALSKGLFNIGFSDYFGGRFIRNENITIRIQTSSGERLRYADFQIEFTDSAKPFLASSYVVDNVLMADRRGSWQQKQLYIKRQIAELQITSQNPLSFIEIGKPSLKKEWIHLLDEAFTDKNTWRFSKALLFGRADLWSEKDTWVVRTLGLAHLFVVSGLHAGFMFVIGTQLCKWLWWLLPNRILLSGFTRWHFEILLILPLLIGYAYLTDWGEPVVRASIMLILYLLSRIMLIKVSAFNIVTFTLWLVLVIEPRSILSAGLWLSFSMVYLLIGFYSVRHRFSRLFYIQLMLSTASMVLILGWQDAISSVSVLINLVLIPFAALIWFPLGWLSSLEVTLFSTNYVYHLLDYFLTPILAFMEWVVFRVPLIEFTLFHSVWPRWLLLALVCFWVFQSPLRRGWLAFTTILCVLFHDTYLPLGRADLSLENVHGVLILQNEDEETLFSNDWENSGSNAFQLVPYIYSQFAIAQHTSTQVKAPDSMDTLLTDVVAKPAKKVIISSKTESELSPENLIGSAVEWVILSKVTSIEQIIRLDALQVNWLVLKPNETLGIYFSDGLIKLHHSTCVYSVFLFKSDTCKRVEKLESVLNYRQI